MSGYCDSNTGPSGPKPDALANCATPRNPLLSNWTANIHLNSGIAKYFLTFVNYSSNSCPGNADTGPLTDYVGVDQKSRSDRDRRERDPPNRVISREVWRNVFRYIRGETRKSYEITYILTSVIRTSTITLGSSMVSQKDV